MRSAGGLQLDHGSYPIPSRCAAHPNKNVKVSWPIRSRSGRRAAPAPPTAAGPDRASYNCAWADYVEWSGLDEDRLAEIRETDGGAVER